MRCQSQAGLMAFGLSDRWAAKGPDTRTLAGCTSCIAWDLHKVAYCHRFSSCFLHANGRVVKHADDTVLLALLSSSEYDDSHALLEFSACRDGAGLQGNISKTKEMAI
ncbi:hypothetical protein ROHU_028732 [Labeo rohita]|uniref:Uncharacterized protein n=1 Tax=Labeo rohita TaxID=84645 RepID=A0A498M3L9_LABRO|nr:hypothetical protein ROHU_028732 [Labeo rohita]